MYTSPLKKHMRARGRARSSGVKRASETETESERERKVQDASLCYFCHVGRIYSLHRCTNIETQIIGKRCETEAEKG